MSTNRLRKSSPEATAESGRPKPRVQTDLLTTVDDFNSDLLPAEKRQSFTSTDIAFNVQWAPNYEVAAATVIREKFDAFVIEEKLGSRSGVDLTREINSRDPQATCVLICQKGSIELEDAAMMAGASDLLEIPRLRAPMLLRAVRFGVERKKSAEHLIYLAQRDCLTGLSNRVLFEDRLRHAIKRASRSNQRVGLLYIDLDGFKKINDTLGHEVGDKLLKVAAQRMVDCVREVDMVARLGGDEFVVILESLAHHEDGVIVANRIINALTAPFSIDRRDLKVSASVGIAVFPEDAADDQKLLLTADKAMYAAKAQGGNCSVFASERKNAKVANRFALEFRLEHALNNNELYLTYQPQADLAEKHIIGAAGLLRWRHPTRGVITSDNFLPLLVDSPFSTKLCLWMVEQACKQIVTWHLKRMNKLKIEVDILKRFFLFDDLAESILDVIQRTGAPAQYLVIGLTENMLKIERKSERQITSLHQIGVQLSVRGIDTGTSSISRHLRRRNPLL
jgi:diguanylate cyclase (GGDEF)-like protein